MIRFLLIVLIRSSGSVFWAIGRVDRLIANTVYGCWFWLVMKTGRYTHHYPPLYLSEKGEQVARLIREDRDLWHEIDATARRKHGDQYTVTQLKEVEAWVRQERVTRPATHPWSTGPSPRGGR